MKIALAQAHLTDDKAANLSTIEEMSRQAAAQAADLVVFPEFAMYHQYAVDATFVAAAEPLDGPFTQELRRIAAEQHIAIAAGMLEKIDGQDRAYNTVYVTDNAGNYVTHYRKLHLFNAFGLRESDIVKPGNQPERAVFDLAGVTVGVMTCYDLRFPEISRDLAATGADVIIMPAVWTPGPRKDDHWNTLVRARAIENTVYVAAATMPAPQSTGGSLAVDPMGIVLGELGEGPALGVYEVDLDRIAQVRAKNPSLDNRRYSVSLIEQ